MRFLLLALISVLLSACGGDRTASPDPAGEPLLPMPQVGEPDDKALKRTIKTYLAEIGAPPSSSYDYSRVDLNNDGRREALVLFRRPYGYWCEDYGCRMLVLEAHDMHFTLAGDIHSIRGPLHVARSKTGDWRDLVVLVDGREDKPKHVALQYDGKRYPNDPATLPAHEWAFHDGGMKLFQ